MTVVAVDTETCLISARCKAPPLVCVTYARQNQPPPGLLKWDDTRNYDILVDWLTHHTIVGANIAYDMGVLAAQWPHLLPLIFQAYEDNRITDIQLRQRLIDIAHGELDHPKHRVGKGCYSLQALAKRHLGIELDKDTWRLGYGELRNVPVEQWPEGARKYATDDAVSTLRVYEAQEPFMPLLADAFRQAKHAFWLHLMSCWGFRTDLEKVQALEAAILRELEKVKAELIHAGLLRPNGTRDTKAAKARMVECGGTKVTPKGDVSLDDEACRASGDPVLEAYAEYTHLTGLLNKDILALKQGEIHARIQPLLETGRISAGGNVEDGGYNITNPARKGGVRECFIPRPGYLLVDSDFDGLELRTMSQVCLHLFGESRMAEALNAGQDPHLVMAAGLLGCDYETAAARYKAKDPAAKEARQFSKIANFGLAGGMGANTFVEYAKNNGIIITLEKAYELKQAWLRTWPEFRRYLAWVGQLTETGPAQVEQLFSGRFRGGLGYSQCANTLFQGLGADAAKAAGWAIARACYDESQRSILFGCRIVAFVHDQFLVEVPDDDLAHERAQEVGRLMCEAAGQWLPDVPPTTTPCLSRCWSKDATAVYDATGRLIPFDDRARRLV